MSVWCFKQVRWQRVQVQSTLYPCLKPAVTMPESGLGTTPWSALWWLVLSVDDSRLRSVCYLRFGQTNSMAMVQRPAAVIQLASLRDISAAINPLGHAEHHV